jgi:hypothetical protein
MRVCGGVVSSVNALVAAWSRLSWSSNARTAKMLGTPSGAATGAPDSHVVHVAEPSWSTLSTTAHSNSAHGSSEVKLQRGSAVRRSARR